MITQNLQEGIILDMDREKLLLVGASRPGSFRQVSRFMSHAERAHPNRGSFRDPETQRLDYPGARRDG